MTARSLQSHAEKVNFLWSIAELLRDSFERGKYQDVILPLTVLRRVDQVLAPTKQAVLERNAELAGKGLENRDGLYGRRPATRKNAEQTLCELKEVCRSLSFPREL